MITRNITCDVCGNSIDSSGGAYVDLHQHDLYQIELATYPPIYPGRYDLCDGCRDALSEWLKERGKELSE